MRVRTLAIAAVVASLVTASAASAAGPSAFLARLMGRAPEEGKTFACFTRVYDDAHLAAHPQQNARAMEALAVVYSAAARESYQLRMGFRFRGRPEEFTTVAECGGAVCAGPPPGSMRVALDDDGSVLMNIPDGAHLWRPGPPDPKNTLDDAFGPDDKVFRLTRTDVSACAEQMFDYEKRTLLGGGR
jgi:hypothetical protein